MADAVMIRYPKICNAIGHNEQFGGTYTVHTKCERCDKVLTTQHDWTTSALVETPQFDCDDDWVHVTQQCNCGYTAYAETDADLSTLTTSTCSTLGTYTHNTVVNGTTYSCGKTHTVSSLDPSVHEGSVTSGGTANVHTKYSCCGITISSEHDPEDSLTLVSLNWDCKNGSMSRTRSCSCSYQMKDRPTSIRSVTTDPATCTSYSKYYHDAVFKDGSSYRCDSNHQGSTLDRSNHTGTSVFGGTSGCHTKYSCCGVTISSEHSYDQSRLDDIYWSSDCSSCTASKTCSRCKLTYCEEGSIEKYFYVSGDCQNKEKWDYIATFDTLGSNVCPDWHYGGYGSHHYEDFSGTDPTCTEDGYTSYRECRICGQTSGYSTIHATGHDMTNPTCTENAYCLTCGATGLPAKGHDWVDTGLDVISGENSVYSVYECSRCGVTKHEYEGEQEPEESSTTTTTSTTSGTGTGDNNTSGSDSETSKPTVCPHLWETITGSDGTIYRTCSLCGLSYIL